MFSSIWNPPFRSKINGSHNLSKSLVGLWLFNERSGSNAYDSSVYNSIPNSTAAVNNIANPSTDTSGWGSSTSGGCIIFDTSNDYVNIPYNSRYTSLPLTLNIWVYRTGAINDAHYVIFGPWQGINSDWTLTIPSSGGGFTADKLNFCWKTASLGRSSWHGIECSSSASSIIPLNQWTMITVSRGIAGLSSTAKMYINGLSIAVTNYGTQAPLQSNTADITVGGDSSGHNMGVKMSNAGIWTRQLNDTEVRLIYYNMYSMFTNPLFNYVIQDTNIKNSYPSSELYYSSFYKDANLVSYYRLENTSDSKGSNTLTNNGPVTFSQGKFNNGANLGISNTTKYLSVNSNLGISGSSDLSISIWIKLNEEVSLTKTQMSFFSHGSTLTLDRYLDLYYSYNGGSFKVTSDASSTVIDYVVSLGITDWHHMVVTRDVSGNTQTLYIDGVNRGSSGLGTGNVGQSKFYLGTNQSITNNLSGVIDDVSIFNKVLSQSEVTQIYQYPVAIQTTDAYNITETSAMTGGTLGLGNDIVWKGVVYSTSSSPTISNGISSSSNISPYGYINVLTELTRNTTYYVRAYAQSNNTIIYGNQISFTTLKIGGVYQPSSFSRIQSITI